MTARKHLRDAFKTAFSSLTLASTTACLLFATAMEPATAFAQDTIQDFDITPEVVTSPAGTSETVDPSDFVLVPTPLRPSFLATTFGRDLEQMRRTTVFLSAKKFGIELPDDLNGVVLNRQRGSNYFYLFHNTLRTEIPCAYFVQRIHKQITNYSTKDGEPESTDHYMVEAIKSSGGQLKKPDQHYASYSLKKYQRRVIVKTLEIGEVVNPENPSQTNPWPFDSGKLSQVIQEYGTDRKEYDAVKFKRAIRWTIRVEMDDSGLFSLQVPKLGIDIQRRTPIMSNGAQLLDQQPERIEVVAGQGLNIVKLGSSEKRCKDLLGPALRVDSTDSVRTLSYEPGVRLRFFRDRLISISVLGDFPGETCEGIKLGDSKKAIGELYGEPFKSTDNTDVFEGIGFQYQDDAIVAITTMKPRPRPKPDPRAEAKPVTESQTQ